MRILLADDHTLVLAGIRKLVESEFEEVETVEDGYALLRAAASHKPDVIVMDISMPLLNGIEACRQLAKTMPEVPVVFLTMHSDLAYVEEAFRAGASGYLFKRSAVSELNHAIRTVAQGQRYITPLIDSQHAGCGLQKDAKKLDIAEKLTARQREVLQLVAEGHSNKEIASLLQVSEKTVDYHKFSIKRELSLKSTAELTQFAIKHRIIGL